VNPKLRLPYLESLTGHVMSVSSQVYHAWYDSEWHDRRRVLQSRRRRKALGSLSILPNHIPSMRQLTGVYQAEGNLKMAEKVLRDLIKIEPLDHETWQKLGQVIAEQLRYDEAAECFSTATRLEDTAPIMPFTVIPRVVHL